MQPGSGELMARSMFPELYDDRYEYERDFPAPSDPEVAALAHAVKLHSLKGSHQAAVQIAELFRSLHGIYWPTGIDHLNALDLLQQNDEESIRLHRALISDMLQNTPGENPGAGHVELKSPPTKAQHAKYLSMARFNLAGIFQRMGRMDEAIEEIELSLTGLADIPMAVTRYTRLACMLQHQGQTEEAESNWRRAHAMDPALFAERVKVLQARYPEVEELPKLQ